MGFKNGCCNCCAWFSIVGCATFGVLATMLYRKNPAVIEHKFKIKLTDEDAIEKRMWVMIKMQIIMIVAALLCFLLAVYYEKTEAKAAE